MAVRRSVRLARRGVRRLGGDEVDADVGGVSAGVGDQDGEALHLAGQDRRGVDGHQLEADLGAVFVQQGHPHRRGHDLGVTDVAQGAGDQDHAGPRRNLLGAHGLEVQADRVHRGADCGIGGRGAGEGVDHLDPEQEGRDDQAHEDAGQTGPDHAVGCGPTQASLLFGAGAEGLGQFRRRGFGQAGGLRDGFRLGRRDDARFGRDAQLQRFIGARPPHLAAGFAADLAAVRPQGVVGNEIAGGAGGAGQYHVADCEAVAPSRKARSTPCP